MKKIYAILLLATIAMVGIEQSRAQAVSTQNVFRGTQVSTQDTRNQILFYDGASSQDTLKPYGAVTATNTPGYAKYVAVIDVTTAIASDSIFVWQSSAGGTRYLAKIIIPATPAPANFTIPLGTTIDSNYVIIKRFKTSSVAVGFRQSF